ncbi:MAG: DNA repair protein RecN [Woeseiaceae bacterium]|nr:DNA repair protein RecN [Woeseiaceae bacterium]
MLTSLTIRDFAIVHQIEVDFGPGMTVLTGETGAGKSILVDALGLVLGERGSAQAVRQGSKRAEFSAEFDVSDEPAAAAWLEEQAMDEDDGCVVRRVITAEGRSRAFINGNPVSMQQLKGFGDLLLDIHGQHFHQSLGKRPVQRDLLDHFGGLMAERSEVEEAYAELRDLTDRLESLRTRASDRASRIELVAFQLEELERLDLGEGEVDELEIERRKLMNSGKLAEGIGSAMQQLSDAEPSAAAMLAGTRRELESLVEFDDGLAEPLELVQSAEIQVAEAYDSIARASDSIESDPARQRWVEERIDAVQSVARKHRVEPYLLIDRRVELACEHEELLHADEIDQELEASVAAAEAAYLELATSLSSKRAASAKSFAGEVTEAMSGLGMPGGVFEIDLSEADSPAPHGIDSIEFLISANPGQKPMPLSKVASGGELARMSLAIQVIASDGSAIPTMVFDEVDSGVGGGVAEMVGLRLAELGEKRQVLCVTHLPQVASLAHHHLRVSKVSDGNATRTGISELGQQERIEELARMLGGVEITKKTLAHASEMLTEAARKRA